MPLIFLGAQRAAARGQGGRLIGSWGKFPACGSRALLEAGRGRHLRIGVINFRRRTFIHTEPSAFLRANLTFRLGACE